MAKRPSSVTEVIDKKYMGKSFSNTIMNTPVDTQRLQNSPLTQEQVEQVKKKYNIKSYSDRMQFESDYSRDARRTIVQDMQIANKTAKERGEKIPFKFNSDNAREKYINQQVNERMEKWYSYYEHRELLILSGQYDEIRMNMYREQYISHLKLGNMHEEVIRNINELTPEQWKKLVEQPDARVDSEKTRELPFLSNIYSYDSRTDNSDTIQEIKEAFKSAGLEYKSFPIEHARDLKRKKFEALKDAYYEGRYDLHQNDKGEWVAPFIGKENGKDSDIVLELVDYIDKHSEEY